MNKVKVSWHNVHSDAVETEAVQEGRKKKKKKRRREPTQSLCPHTLHYPGSLSSDSVGSGAGDGRGLLRLLFRALARQEPSGLHLEADRLSSWEVTAPITCN